MTYVKICQRKLTFVIHKKSIWKIWKVIIQYVTKTWLKTLKTASKKVVHKVIEATSEFIGNRIADKTEKPKT